jgi:hypothetical protein
MGKAGQQLRLFSYKKGEYAPLTEIGFAGGFVTAARFDFSNRLL